VKGLGALRCKAFLTQTKAKIVLCAFPMLETFNFLISCFNF